MPEKVEFLYYLQKSNGDSYYVDNGAVLTTATATPISNDPTTWAEKAVEWRRGFDLWGVFTAMSNPLKFTRDGAKIIRHVYFNEGINGDLTLKIERLDRTTQTYFDYWSGEIDFTKIIDVDNTITAIALDGSYPEKLKSRRTSKYEIDIDTNPYFYVRMDGITLKTQLNYTTVTEPGPTFPTDMFNGLFSAENIQPTIGPLPSDNSNLVGLQTTQSFRNNPSPFGAFEWSKDHYFFIAARESDFTMDVDFRVALRNPIQSGTPVIRLQMQVVIFDINGNPTNTVVFTSPTGQADNGSTTIHPLNFTTAAFSMFENESLSVALNVIGSGGGPATAGNYDIAVEQGDITLNFETKLEETYIKALKPVEVFDDLVEQIGDGGVSKSVTSTINDYAVTCGDSLRGLDGSKIKTTFDEFWESFNHRFNLATYYDKTTNTHNLVDKSDVFNSGSTIFTINEDVTDFQLTPFTEVLPKSIIVGEKDHNHSEVNGKDCFIAPFEFQTPVIRSQETLDLQSPYFADPYLIELTRANLTGKTTTDSDADNENFILHIESTPAGTHNGRDYYDLYRDGAMTINGLLFPDDMFNINLSPKRDLLRNGNLIRSVLHNMGTEYLEFISALRNADMDTTSGAVTVDENANELISGLDSPLLYPYLFEFTCIQPINVQALIDNDPYGIIEFNYNGETYEGFLISSSDNPATKSSQQLTLLSTTNNDLTKLIR